MMCRYIHLYHPVNLGFATWAPFNMQWSLGDHQQMWDLICWKGLLGASALGRWMQTMGVVIKSQNLLTGVTVHTMYTLSKIWKGPELALNLIVLVDKFHELRQVQIVYSTSFEYCTLKRPHLLPFQSLNCYLFLLVLAIISMLVLFCWSISGEKNCYHAGFCILCRHFWWLISNLYNQMWFSTSCLLA